MDKRILLGTAAALALAASGAFAGPGALLWHQNANFGQNIFSENSGETANAAADDFVVPAGKIWHVAELDVTGVYFNGSGPAASEVVTFYTDRNGRPGRVHQGPFTLNCSSNNDGPFHCALPKTVRLKAGTWWVSFVANCSFVSCGNWGWTENAIVQGNEAVWRNSSGKCTSFKPLHRCFGGAPADMAFDLFGRSVDAH